MYITLGFKHHSEALVHFFDRIVHVWHEYVFSVCPSGKKESRLTSDFLTHKCELGFIVRTRIMVLALVHDSVYLVSNGLASPFVF